MAGTFRKNITNAFFSKTSNAKEGFYLPSGPVVKGGAAVVASGRYYYSVFTTNGTFNVINGSVFADILLVGGGGGGGIGNNQTTGTLSNTVYYEYGGGGGGGGYVTVFSGQKLSGNYTVIIGSGGAGGAVGSSAAVPGTTGGSTSFGALVTATGGGYGGGGAGGPGGAGGGSSTSVALPGSGVTYSGGYGSSGIGTQTGGGGGGNGRVGASGTTTSGGAGGNGTTAYSDWLSVISGAMSSAFITATSGTYLGGGGGGGGFESVGKIISNAPGGKGGIGGGGNGTNGANLGTVGNGAANTGGGGGGGIGDNPSGQGGTSGGTGGSGLVVVRYWNPVATTKSSSAITTLRNVISKNRGKFIRATISAGILTKKNVQKIVRVSTIDTINSAKLVFKNLKTTFSAAPKVTKSVTKTVKTLYINSVKSVKVIYKNPRLIVVAIPSLSKRVFKVVSAVSIKTFKFTAGKILSKVAKNIVVSAQKLTRQSRLNRKVNVVQPVQATVIRKINRGRKSSVTVSYSIASTRKRTAIRRVIATVSAIGKNIATRPFYIFTHESAATSQAPAIAGFNIENNVDQIGDFTVEQDLPPTDYNETAMSTPSDYIEPDNNEAPNDHTEPDYPAGEDVVPT